MKDDTGDSFWGNSDNFCVQCEALSLGVKHVDSVENSFKNFI